MSDFLRFIQPAENLIELRLIKNGVVNQAFETDRDWASTLAVEASVDGWDAYYGVLPRIEKHGDSSAIRDRSSVLWADIDAKAVGSKRLALARLRDFPVWPNVVVDSGHGYHGYWVLREEIDFGHAQRLMKDIAASVGGDKVYDKARILRVPGTTNWKDRDNPADVRLVSFDPDFLIPVSWIESLYPPPPAPIVMHRYKEKSGEAVSYFDLPKYLTEKIEQGAPQGSRSEESYRAMLGLIEHGWSDEEILTVFENYAIGEKMREKKDGLRWFWRSLEKARKWVQGLD